MRTSFKQCFIGWRSPNSVRIASLQIFLLGALYPLGFAPFNYWPVSLISLIALVFVLYRSLEAPLADHKDAKPQAKAEGWRLLLHLSSLCQPLGVFRAVFSWSMGAFGFGVSWVYVSIHDYGHANWFLASFITLLFVLLLSSVKAASFLLLKKMSVWFGLGRLILMLPLVWVFSEFVQTKLFSGFPWLFAGYTQLEGPLSLLATFLGVYGLSWNLLLLACAIVFVVMGYFKPEKRHFWLSLTIPSLLLGILFPLLAWIMPSESPTSASKSIKVALVQPNISQNDKWDRRHFARIIDILYQQSNPYWDADLLVWPEGAIPAYRHQVKDILNDLTKLAKQSNTALLLGIPIHDFEQQISYSSIISLGSAPQVYHKQVLVPFGEYVPLGQWLRGVIKFFNLPMSSFSPATEPQKAMNFTNFQVIPAICYEITYANIIHQLVKQADASSNKPKLLVTISNDAWFGSSFGPDQHLQMAQMRALELGIPLVRSTNDGITAIVDARGKLLAQLPRYQQATLVNEVKLEDYNTFYRRYGLWGIGLVLLGNLLLLLVHRIVFSKTTHQ